MEKKTTNCDTNPSAKLVNSDAAQMKKPFQKPKLKYVAPKLVKQANVEDITAGFFGGIYLPS